MNVIEIMPRITKGKAVDELDDAASRSVSRGGVVKLTMVVHVSTAIAITLTDRVTIATTHEVAPTA